MFDFLGELFGGVARWLVELFDGIVGWFFELFCLCKRSGKDAETSRSKKTKR